MNKGQTIWVTSLYGMKTRVPLVEIHYEDTSVQLLLKEARDLALNLLRAAEASEQDAFLLEWAKSEIKVTDNGARRLLSGYREWRKKNNEIRDKDEPAG